MSFISFIVVILQVKISPNPFDEGTQRIAYYGMEAKAGGGFTSLFMSWPKPATSSATLVFKTFKHIYGSGMGDGRDHYLTMVETQAIALYLSKEFNRIKPKDAKDIHFLDVKLVEVNRHNSSFCVFNILYISMCFVSSGYWT